MQLLVRGLIPLVPVLLAACAQNQPLRLYEGQPRPKAQIAVIEVPAELEIMRINGRRVEGVNTLLSPDNRDLHLKPGRYRILAYYKDLWEMSGDAHDVIKTDPALFMVDARAGHTYRLGFDEPENIEQARALEKKFSGYVLDTDTGSKIPTKASGLSFRDGVLGSLGQIAGLQATRSGSGEPPAPSGDTVRPLAAPDQGDSAAGEDSTPATGGPTASAGGTGKADAQSIGGGGTTSNASDSGDYLRMLKAYWSQATKEERRAFLQWISEQETGRD